MQNKEDQFYSGTTQNSGCIIVVFFLAPVGSKSVDGFAQSSEGEQSVGRWVASTELAESFCRRLGAAVGQHHVAEAPAGALQRGLLLERGEHVGSDDARPQARVVRRPPVAADGVDEPARMRVALDQLEAAVEARPQPLYHVQPKVLPATHSLRYHTRFPHIRSCVRISI